MNSYRIESEMEVSSYLANLRYALEYIKIRVELLADKLYGEHTVFVMSFHYTTVPFANTDFPYKK